MVVTVKITVKHRLFSDIHQVASTSNTWCAGSMRVCHPNGDWIDSAIFGGFTHVMNRQTDRYTDHTMPRHA